MGLKENTKPVSIFYLEEENSHKSSSFHPFHVASQYKNFNQNIFRGETKAMNCTRIKIRFRLKAIRLCSIQHNFSFAFFVYIVLLLRGYNNLFSSSFSLKSFYINLDSFPFAIILLKLCKFKEFSSLVSSLLKHFIK